MLKNISLFNYKHLISTYRETLQTVMENDAVKAYIFKQVKLPPKRSISVCVRKLLVFCLGRRTSLTKQLYFTT